MNVLITANSYEARRSLASRSTQRDFHMISANERALLFTAVLPQSTQVPWHERVDQPPQCCSRWCGSATGKLQNCLNTCVRTRAQATDLVSILIYYIILGMVKRIIRNETDGTSTSQLVRIKSTRPQTNEIGAVSHRIIEIGGSTMNITIVKCHKKLTVRSCDKTTAGAQQRPPVWCARNAYVR